MLSIRLFGLGMIGLGVALVGPLSSWTRETLVVRGRQRSSNLPQRALYDWMAVIIMFWRAAGALVVIAGIIYVVHPPAHL